MYDHLLYLTSAAWKCPAPQVLDINKNFQYTIVNLLFFLPINFDIHFGCFKRTISSRRFF